MVAEHNWKKLLSIKRYGEQDSLRKMTFHKHLGSKDFRLPHEKDFDRVVFSTPIRRLQDKTQVFPLDQHDSVRTRLTHSLEVGNIARTLAAQLVSELSLTEIAGDDVKRSVPALVAAIAIAHDVGNPPFGHQGEAAIRLWVRGVASKLSSDLTDEHQALLNDYLYFDGNPQGFRLLTKLQGVSEGGLNLTASTLRAYFKYPWSASSKEVNPEKPKFGYFQTEKGLFDWAGRQVGLREGQRHPLASIMEASDDICYSILDVEDGVKKELVSTSHLIVYLKNKGAKTKARAWTKEIATQYYNDVLWLERQGIEGRYAEDVLMQLLRSYFISLAVSMAVPQLKKAIALDGAMVGNPCLDHPECGAFLRLLKDYTKAFIYSHRTVEKVELQGHRIIPYLLTAFWSALERVDRGFSTKVDQYVIKQISLNYFRVYEETRNAYPVWYARLQLVCDMVCGMTDSYAIALADEFRRLGIEVD